MNNSIFGKTMENVQKHGNIKLATTEKRKNCLFITENFLAIEMRKTQILMNKPVYLSLSILDLSKTVMNDFWYNCNE